MSNPLLSNPLIARVRRNHALEHATIHILSQQQRGMSLVGRSTPDGFLIYGAVPTESIVRAVEEALSRLRSGQRELAIHPACGTNFVAGGLLAGLGAFAVLTPKRRSWSEWLGRLPTVVLVATLGMILGQRLGSVLQAHLSTDANVGELAIAEVAREEHGPVPVHRIRTRG